MKRILKAFVFSLCSLFVFFAAGCGGCKVDMDTNDRSSAIYYAPRFDGENYYYNLSYDNLSSGDRYIRINKETGNVSFFENEGEINGYFPDVPFKDEPPKTWQKTDGDVTYEYEIPSPPVILDSMDNGWRGYVRVSRENYPILENLTKKYEINGVSFTHICILDGDDGTAYGFVNVYDHTSGALFGGGVAGVSGISYGAFINLDIATGEVHELLRVDGGCITAFDRNTVMFFKDRKYFAQNVGGESVFLLDDLAYDSGATHYSFSYTYFNDVHFVLYMHSDMGRGKFDYAYVFDADGNLISSCEERVN